MKKIAVIGAGNVGTVLGLALFNKGYTLVGAVTKSSEGRAEAAKQLQCPVYSQPHQASREAEIVFITTPDRVIEDVCQQMAREGGFYKGQIVIHCSGAHSSEILQSSRKAGAWALSMHPLQTFPGTEAGLRALPGTFFAVEGDTGALPTAGDLVNALGGEMLPISTEMKTLYHAAACVACNYLTSLLDGALRMYEQAGVSREQAVKALYPLVSRTLENIKEAGPEQALTGPIARGDTTTVKAHVEELQRFLPELLPFYQIMGQQTVGLALRKGTLTETQAENINYYLKQGGTD